MLRLEMCPQNYSMCTVISIIDEYVMLKEFCCSNINLSETIMIFLREYQNIYGSDTISTTMIFCFNVGS